MVGERWNLTAGRNVVDESQGELLEMNVAGMPQHSGRGAVEGTRQTRQPADELGRHAGKVGEQVVAELGRSADELAPIG